jgi:hypothetical protein
MYVSIVLGNLQAEIAMREAGKPGMSDEEVCQSMYTCILKILNLTTMPAVGSNI